MVAVKKHSTSTIQAPRFLDFAIFPTLRSKSISIFRHKDSSFTNSFSVNFPSFLVSSQYEIHCVHRLLEIH
ncbi:hypothetical protein SLEP1_g29765 [Rubroshorea leprosula]|uniref:Uncharacterized protein n=1 Tax=Rubroshorea leprosula TaxID=152421 RepID=A0AAV5JY11_9ROSI|nr:hypothetical protein SLEP1_g29765 [Rubroshorea leprosula]